VRTCVEFPDEDEEPGYDQLQQIHLNAQASYVLLSLLDKDEFDRVNSLEKAKDIWDTLQRAHEVTKLIKKAERQLVEGQLDRFVMLHDESPQDIYNSVKKLVNKVRAYVSRRWGGQRMIKRTLRACVVKDTTVIFLIQQDPNFKRMTPVDVLGKIVNHEMLIEEANHVKNLSKDITSSKKQDIAFKASKKGKSKKVVEESSSEEEDNDDDDESIKYDPNVMALFIRRFSKMMSK
jgi:ribosomal protein L17